MIKVEHIEIYGFEAAIRGMRNPMNSWEKSDSFECGDISGYGECINYVHGDCPRCLNAPNTYCVGSNDLDLMQRLFKAGTEHRKFMRQIFVSMDITSNHTFWAEFDTYKVGVTRNSCSKIHKIHVKEFVPEDFSREGIEEVGGRTKEVFLSVVEELERLRKLFNQTHEKRYWRAIIELLPMGYNLKATITMTYENAASMIKQRSGHKLDEWREFVETLKRLPYIAQIVGGCTAEM